VNITFAELKAKIVRILGDTVVPGTSGGPETAGQIYEADLLKDAVHAALDAITVRCFKPSTFTIKPSGEATALPDDVIDIEAVYDETNSVFLEKLNMQVDKARIPTRGNGWLLYPAGYVSLAAVIDGEVGATVYYSATWAKPEDDEDPIDTPQMAATALTYFAASYCLLNTATQTASIRQFDTKVDSGKPTDNPAEQMSTYFMKRFELELQRIPPSQKAMH
jgi:hypothetical protein